MPTKRLVILANSVKKGQHCIAGREIVDENAKNPYGSWIRPVSGVSEGELTHSDCCFADNTLPEVGDVVDVPLARYASSPAQPENWYIDPQAFWVKVGDQVTLGLPGVFAEHPADLWLEPGVKQDRISTNGLATLGRDHSICLVPVTDFRMQLEWHTMDHYHRRRASFKYNDRYYNLSLTDPKMDEHILPYPPNGQDKEIELPTGGEKILCISLTPAFQGYHYKIVATVFEVAK